MGSTGNAKTQGNTPTLPNAQQLQTQNSTKHGLADDADSTTIQKYYKDNYGIDVGGSYFRDNLDTKLLARTAQGLDNILAELGKDVMHELGIRIVSSKSTFGKNSRAYAQTSLQSNTIFVNPSKFNSYDGVKASVHNDVASGFHPKGMKAGDIIVHELGHNLEFLINRRANPNNKLTQWQADYNQTYSKAIVQAAYAELKKEQPNLYKTEKQARAGISGYADSKWKGTTAYTECMAEAVADYARNGKNASPLSVKIWEGIKAALK